MENTAPFPSWVYDETYQRWNAPVNHADDGFLYIWDEENIEWIKTDVQINDF